MKYHSLMSQFFFPVNFFCRIFTVYPLHPYSHKKSFTPRLNLIEFDVNFLFSEQINWERKKRKRDRVRGKGLRRGEKPESRRLYICDQMCTQWVSSVWTFRRIRVLDTHGVVGRDPKHRPPLLFPTGLRWTWLFSVANNTFLVVTPLSSVSIRAVTHREVPETKAISSFLPILIRIPEISKL